MIYKPDVSGPLYDHIQEARQRAAFLELFALCLSAYPDPEGVLLEENLIGFYHVAGDLAALMEAIQERAAAMT